MHGGVEFFPRHLSIVTGFAHVEVEGDFGDDAREVLAITLRANWRGRVVSSVGLVV